MPTPMQAFCEVAARHGRVDASDMEAVRRFYRRTLRTLSAAQVLAILEDLLAREGGPEDRSSDPFYPVGADLPRLQASPPVEVPLLALRWHDMLRRLLRRGARR